MWASIGAKVSTVGKLRKNRGMYLRYGHAIKSIDENTLFPDAWEITVSAKDLTPNNFNTYIHHFIHGFQSNVEIIKTKVTSNAWLNDIGNADERAKLKAELDALRKKRENTLSQDFVLFAKSESDVNKKQLMLNTAYKQAGITDYWLLDELTESAEEKRLKPIANAAIAEVEKLRQRLADLRAKEKITPEIQTEIDNIIAQINPEGKDNVYTKAYDAALALAKAQFVRTRGLDKFNESDKSAAEIVERSAKLQVGTIPTSTQTIMTIFEKISQTENAATIETIRTDLENGTINDAYVRNLWNKYADDDFKVNYTGKIGSGAGLTDAQKQRTKLVDQFFSQTWAETHGSDAYADYNILYEWAETGGDVAKLNAGMTNFNNGMRDIWNELLKQNVSLQEKYTVEHK